MFKRLGSLAASIFVVGGVLGSSQAADSKNWKNAAELSAVSSNGNTKSQSGSVKDTYLYNWTSTALELIGSAMGAKSNGQTIAEKYFLSEKLSQKLSEKNYAYQKSTWDKDRFAGIGNRYDNGVGLGRQFIKDPVNSLIGELGGGY